MYPEILFEETWCKTHKGTDHEREYSTVIRAEDPDYLVIEKVDSNSVYYERILFNRDELVAFVKFLKQENYIDVYISDFEYSIEKG